jgi:hypothetical protein
VTSTVLAAERLNSDLVGRVPRRVAMVAIIGVAVAVGAFVGLHGIEAVGLLLAAGGVVLVAVRPQVGAYALIGVTPLVVGIDRGVLLPVLRPNEGLLLVAGAGLAIRALTRFTTGAPIHFRMGRVDIALVALAVTSSLLPLCWMFATGRDIGTDDLLYAATLWKYLLLYVVVRVGIRTERQVRIAIGLALASGVVVAVIAVLQSLHLFGVPELLGRWYAPHDDQEALNIGRGTSTLSSAIGVGDVMAFLLAGSIAWWKRDVRLRPLMAVLAIVFLLGGIGSGQFSAVFALVIAAVVAALLTGTIKRVALVAVPLLVASVLLLQPVIETRLEGFQSREGVPHSWSARLENLETFFWPEIAKDWNWTFGVQTSARVPATEPWRDWVYIESGYTWLVWNGGLPFLIAFIVFVVLALRALVPIARTRDDSIGVAATASAAAVAVVAVLMLLDPHLTMRGTADLGFALLALAFTSSVTSIEKEGTAPCRPVSV